MSIPFHYSIFQSKDKRSHTKGVKGILSFIDAELLFEYKVYDLFGNSLSTLSKFSIQLAQIKKLSFKKGWPFLGSKLIIEAKQAAFFEPLPGSEQGAIVLKINRTDKKEASHFSAKMNEYLLQQQASEGG